MIREIHIRNYALIDELSLDFEKGFSIFTGETGAGKSILIGAIGLLLGDRANLDSIRSGSEEAEVSGVFDVSAMRASLKSLLDELSIEPLDHTLIIRRRLARNDRSKILVNQVPLPLASLKKIGDALVDLHGQHEHQSLLSEETHGAVIDELPGVHYARSAFAEAFAAYASIRAAAQAFESRVAALNERKEMLEFQYKELVDLSLSGGEEEKLEQELNLLSSASQRNEAVTDILSILSASQGSVEKQIAQVRRRLETLAKYDASVEPWVKDVENALSVMNELETFCGSYLAQTGGASKDARIEHLNARLAKIQRLKKKYACTFPDLITRRDTLKKDLAALVNINADRTEMARKSAAALAACQAAGKTLTASRTQAALDFDAKISSYMERLGFSGGRWQTVFIPHPEPRETGFEETRFMVQTNKGEPLLPLVKTASGGEISRLMLAIKSVMARHDRIPILIFDEIDTGIGGMLAGTVAQALRDLALSHQVLCITHLHQIAGSADHHFHVFKESLGTRTVTRVIHLGDKERVDEISRMLGGDSAAAKRHAKEILEKKRA